MKKIFLIGIILILFSGCSAIVQKIGENKIEQGIEQYQKYGVSKNSITNLVEGLEYFPESEIGINTLKAQYNILSEEKKKILTKNSLTLKDIEMLQLYFLASEKISKLDSKVKIAFINMKNLQDEKIKYRILTEQFINKDKTEKLSRAEKISRIKLYKEMLQYSQSPKVSSKIRELEKEVTIRIYITGDFRNNYRGYDLDYILNQTAQSNKGKKLDDYIYLEGYLDRHDILGKNDLVVKVKVDTLRNTTLSVEKKSISEDGKKIAVIEKKEILMRGSYEIIDPMTESIIKRSHFSYQEEYKLKTEKGSEYIHFGNEREIVENILENYFDKLIRYDLEIINNFEV